MLADRLRRRCPVHPRHDQVHEHHVELLLLADADGFLAAARLGSELQVVEDHQERRQTAADDGMIVDYHHADYVRLAHFPSPRNAITGRAITHSDQAGFTGSHSVGNQPGW
jgi:hypothetical protein